MLRRAAVAGSWYPGSPERLSAELTAHLQRADQATSTAAPPTADLVGLIAPHAGLMYSGPVAAYAYRLLRDRAFDLTVLVGPSHFVPFEGVSVWSSGAFETPFGKLLVDDRATAEVVASCPVVKDLRSAHEREHSLEMQLPFLKLLAPDTAILPLVMGQQTRATVFALADALATVAQERRTLLVASSDLSHYQHAAVAARLDQQVIDRVEEMDDDGLMGLLEKRPDHACGGGPMVSVLRAAKAVGARSCEVLRYADSGDVSGDKSAVVGYLAAAVWK